MMTVSPAFRHAVTSEDQAATLAWAMQIDQRFGREDLPDDAIALISAFDGLHDCQLAQQWISSHTASNELAIQQWAGSQ